MIQAFTNFFHNFFQMQITFAVLFSLLYILVRAAIKLQEKSISFTAQYRVLKILPLFVLLSMGLGIFLRPALSDLSQAFYTNDTNIFKNFALFNKFAVFDEFAIVNAFTAFNESAAVNKLAAFSESIAFNKFALFNESTNVLLSQLHNFCTAIYCLVLLILLTRLRLQFRNFRKVLIQKELLDSPAFLIDLMEKEKEKWNMSINVRICRCHTMLSPFTFGIRKPVIVIPASACSSSSAEGQTANNLAMLISHELVHCLRKDMLIKAAVGLLRAFQWFNPLIYAYSRQTELACELSCDELVTKAFSFDERKQYAEWILHYAKAQNGIRAQKNPAFSLQLSNLKLVKKRLNHILHPASCKPGLGGKLIIACAFLLTVWGTVFMYGAVSNQPADFPLSLVTRTQSRYKLIKVNYPDGQEKEQYEYEEYQDGFWWRGTLNAQSNRKTSVGLTEVTFSGKIDKCVP